MNIFQASLADVAFINAVCARVLTSEAHKWKGDEGLDAMQAASGMAISVYDIGPRNAKTRYVRFDRGDNGFEIEIGPQPGLVVVDNRTDDDPTPGSPVPMAMAAAA